VPASNQGERLVYTRRLGARLVEGVRAACSGRARRGGHRLHFYGGLCVIVVKIGAEGGGASLQEMRYVKGVRVEDGLGVVAS